MPTKEYLLNDTDGVCERPCRTSFVPFGEKTLVVLQLGEDYELDPCGVTTIIPWEVLVPGFKMSEFHKSTFCPHPQAMDVEPVSPKLREEVRKVLRTAHFLGDIRFW